MELVCKKRKIYIILINWDILGNLSRSAKGLHGRVQGINKKTKKGGNQMKTPTLKEAIEVLREYTNTDDYVQANYQQYLVQGEHSDNTCDTSSYYRKCTLIIIEYAEQQQHPAGQTAEDDLCNFCPLEKKGVYGVPGGFAAGCEGSKCDVARDNKLASHPVQLPTDEEIEKNGKYGGLRDNELQMYWEGAKWMRDQIKK
jgi:hypothetical protein